MNPRESIDAEEADAINDRFIHSSTLPGLTSGAQKKERRINGVPRFVHDRDDQPMAR
jgi:hypothetical protein